MAGRFWQLVEATTRDHPEMFCVYGQPFSSLNKVGTCSCFVYSVLSLLDQTDAEALSDSVIHVQM